MKTLEAPKWGESSIGLEATDVTGTATIRAEGLLASTPAGTVASAIASRMQMPSNVPWMLRSDRTGALLQDDKPIGEQIEPGDRVIVTPKTHLGAAK